MRYKDRAKWEEQEVELLRSGELGEKFLEFLKFWLTVAERVLPNPLTGDTHVIGPQGVMNALRMALDVAEHEHGFLSVEWIGQMLTLIAMHWEHGEEVSAGMTVIERRIMEQETARKLLQLQSEAARASGSEG